MATDISNIDDLLMTDTSPSTPPTSESKDDYEPNDDANSNSNDESEYNEDELEEHGLSHDINDEKDDNESESEEKKENKHDYDEYGNDKPKKRTYTQEEHEEILNREIRRRGKEKKEQAIQQVQQQNVRNDVAYNPESEESWQNELEQIVENTFTKIQQKKLLEQQQYQDKQIQIEFEDKFTKGMDRFSDFRHIVGSQNITDPMTYALREMSDPAAFIYAASKRQPKELERIANLRSPHAQMIEMGKLEDRMRKSAPGTKAPKPVSRSHDDGNIPVTNKKKELSIDDLIAKSDAKRKAQFNQRRTK